MPRVTLPSSSFPRGLSIGVIDLHGGLPPGRFEGRKPADGLLDTRGLAAVAAAFGENDDLAPRFHWCEDEVMRRVEPALDFRKKIAGNMLR